jgi:hypothetical protein
MTPAGLAVGWCSSSCVQCWSRLQPPAPRRTHVYTPQALSRLLQHAQMLRAQMQLSQQRAQRQTATGTTSFAGQDPTTQSQSQTGPSQVSDLDAWWLWWTDERVAARIQHARSRTAPEPRSEATAMLLVRTSAMRQSLIARMAHAHRMAHANNRMAHAPWCIAQEPHVPGSGARKTHKDTGQLSR